MIFADNRINLPITQADFFTDYEWTIINIDPFSDLALLVLGTVLLALLTTVTKMPMQLTTIQFVCPDMLIDPLMTNR